MQAPTRRWTPRQGFLLIALSCTGLMAYGLYTEHFQGLIPCPLCMTQRFFYVLTGVTALLAVIHNPGVTGVRLYGLISALFSIGGGIFAGRQVWLQHLPEDQVPACGPSLEYMFDVMPFSEALRTLMMGDGNCAEVQWTFVGLSMPEWSLIWFAGLGLAGLGLALLAARPGRDHTPAA